MAGQRVRSPLLDGPSYWAKVAGSFVVVAVVVLLSWVLVLGASLLLWSWVR